jgi:hypothetical protein
MLTFDINARAVFDGYLLIDPLNIDPDRFDATLPTLRCTPPSLANADALTPRLVDLAALSPEQLASVRRMIAEENLDLVPPVLCAWLGSTLPIEALARHIARFLVGPDADGRQVMWRYYDPRVFSLAARILSDEQRRMLVGAVDLWRFPWCGRWWSVEGPGQVVQPLDSGMAAWPTPEQWSRLNQSALITRVLRELPDIRPPFSDAQCLRYQSEIGLSLIHARQELDLKDNDDLTQYALACARYGDRFRRHPKLATAWSALARGEIGWPTLRDMLSDDEYRTLEIQTTGSA